MKFIINMLSGERGPSSKRSVMVWLLLLFTYVILNNLHTGKSLSPMYSEQLFELLIIAIASVFGEKIVSVLQRIRGKDTPTAPVKPEADK